MNKFKFFILLTIFSSLLFFYTWANFYSFVAYPYIVMLLGSRGVNILSSTPLVISGHLLITALFAINFWQLLNRKFSKLFLKFEMVLYLVALFAIVMLKSRGVQGINLNPVTVFTTFLERPFEFFVNLIIFIPFGAFIRKFIKNLSGAVKVGGLIIITLEIAQFIFKLGITDVSDVLINLSGLILGYLTMEWLSDAGWTAKESGKYIVLTK